MVICGSGGASRDRLGDYVDKTVPVSLNQYDSGRRMRTVEPRLTISNPFLLLYIPNNIILSHS